MTSVTPIFAEHTGDLERELVLLRVGAAVRHLDVVDQAEDRHPLGRLLGRHVERRAALTPEVDRVEEVAEGVGDDHEPAEVIQHRSQLLRLANARHISGEPNGDDVAHVRRDLHAPVHEEAALLAKLFERVVLPHAVVLRDVDAGEADLLRHFSQLLGLEGGVGRAAHRMHVHIDDRAGHALMLSGCLAVRPHRRRLCRRQRTNDVYLLPPPNTRHTRADRPRLWLAIGHAEERRPGSADVN